MRLFTLLLAVLALGACSKRQRVEKRLEGNWIYTELLKTDGSHVYYSDTYNFGSGDADGKTYLPMTVFSADTTHGSYLISKKGNELLLIYDNVFPTNADTCSVEDMDAKMMVIRGPKGVMYFTKQ